MGIVLNTLHGGTGSFRLTSPVAFRSVKAGRQEGTGLGGQGRGQGRGGSGGGWEGGAGACVWGRGEQALGPT